MTVPKHTPGPWVVARDEDDDEDARDCGWINGNGSPVVEYSGCGSHAAHWPNPADKTLALAAPDLLAALQIMVGDVGVGVSFYERIRIAKAAIAKATGEQP